MSGRTADVEVLARRQGEVAGKPAILLDLRSGGKDDAIQQRLAMVELPGRLVGTFAMTIPQPDVPQKAPLFDRILSTVRIGPPGSDS